MFYMSADAIAQSLNEHFNSENIHFQIIEHGGVLHVYLNHESDNQPNYARVTEKIQNEVATHWQGREDGFWFYSRQLGSTDPDWQSYMQIPRQVADRRSSLGSSPSIKMPEETPLVDLTDLSQAESTEDIEAPTEFVSLLGNLKSEEEPTAIVSLTGDMESEEEPTAMVRLNESNGQQAAMTSIPGFDGDDVDDDGAETEMVSMTPSSGHHIPEKSSSPVAVSTVSQERSIDIDEEAATEMVSLGRASTSPAVAPPVLQDEYDEHAPTEIAAIGAPSRNPLPAAHQAGVVPEEYDEDAPTEMVSGGGAASTRSCRSPSC